MDWLLVDTLDGCTHCGGCKNKNAAPPVSQNALNTEATACVGPQRNFIALVVSRHRRSNWPLNKTSWVSGHCFHLTVRSICPQNVWKCIGIHYWCRFHFHANRTIKNKGGFSKPSSLQQKIACNTHLQCWTESPSNVRSVRVHSLPHDNYKMESRNHNAL